MTEKLNEPSKSGLLLRHPALSVAVGIVATVVLALLVVIFLLRTGGAKAVSDNAALIGAMVALGGVFTTQMVSIALDDRRTRETRAIEERRTNETRDIEERRTNETRDIEAKRTQETHAIEERREQEAALQQYFEEMGELLRQGLRRTYTKEMGELLAQGLLEPHEKDEQRIYDEQQLRSLAQVQTNLILRGLDPRRKWLLLQFLLDTRLIERDATIINLDSADLRKAIFCEYLAMDRSAASTYLLNDADPSSYYPPLVHDQAAFSAMDRCS
jgi:hypothetical protein